MGGEARGGIGHEHAHVASDLTLEVLSRHHVVVGARTGRGDRARAPHRAAVFRRLTRMPV